MLSFVGAEVLFVVGGVLLIVFSLNMEAQMSEAPTIKSLARDLLLMMCPLSAGVGNAVLVFVTFLISIPAMVMPTTRGWLKFHGYLVVVCAFYTMVLGLSIWFETLKTRRNLSSVWNAQPASSQSLLQQEFNCCGYANSTSPPFVVDTTCTNSLVAANLGGCVGPLSTFGNNFLDLIFTGAFGIVGVDVLLILMTSILLKDRKEKARYRVIDEKNGTGSF